MALQQKILLCSSIVIATITSVFVLYVSLSKADSTYNSPTEYQLAVAEKFPLHIDSKFFPLQISNNAALLIQNEFVYPERHCEFCTHFIQDFNIFKEGGMAYVPSSNTNNIIGAKRVTFFAMGDSGGERIRIMIAADDDLNAVPDTNSSSQVSSITSKFAIKTDYITLTENWKKYQIDVSNISLNTNSIPFALQIARVDGADRSDFYIKDITYDAKIAMNPLNQ